MSESRTDPPVPADTDVEEVDPYEGMTEGEKEAAEMAATGTPVYPGNDPLFTEQTGIDRETGEKTAENLEAEAADREVQEREAERTAARTGIPSRTGTDDAKAAKAAKDKKAEASTTKDKDW